jgi:molybdenum cofactor synthesis domain-containing protein
MASVGVVIVGNEVLSGRVEEQNARFLCSALRGAGAALGRITVVPDDVDQIAEDVRHMTARFDFVLTTGGIGSTHDDVTLPGIAKAFGVPLVTEPHLEGLLRGHFKERFDAAIARMARVPNGAELIGRDAPIYPLVRVRNVFALPGVPRFLREKFELARPFLQGAPVTLRQVFLRVPEDRVAALLERFDADHPNVSVGSYPKFEDEDHDVEVSLEAGDPTVVDAALQDLEARIPTEWIVRVA